MSLFIKLHLLFFLFFFFNDTATTEIYTLSLHDALPICLALDRAGVPARVVNPREIGFEVEGRSEEHTSELQSLTNLVCRLLLEKKTNKQTSPANGGLRTTKNTPPAHRLLATLSGFPSTR